MQLCDATTKAAKMTTTTTCKSGTSAGCAGASALSGMWKRLQGH